MYPPPWNPLIDKTKNLAIHTQNYKNVFFYALRLCKFARNISLVMFFFPDLCIWDEELS